MRRLAFSLSLALPLLGGCSLGLDPVMVSPDEGESSPGDGDDHGDGDGDRERDLGASADGGTEGALDPDAPDGGSPTGDGDGDGSAGDGDGEGDGDGDGSSGDGDGDGPSGDGDDDGSSGDGDGDDDGSSGDGDGDGSSGDGDGWICDTAWQGTDDGCDCGCGQTDPDCPDDSAESCDWNSCPEADQGYAPDPSDPTQCVLDDGGDGDGDGDGSSGDGDGDGDGDEGDEPLPPGSACGCDDDCAGTTTNPGLCVYGVCMQVAAETCSGAGSEDECSPGSRCWSLSESGQGLCWPDCDSFSCAGVCDSDGSCVFDDITSGECDETCSELCLGEGADDPPPAELGAAPSGPIPDCEGAYPDFACDGGEAWCGEVIPFEPDLGDGWWDYPINGETSANEYRSYARRDLVQLIKYATARTACLAEGWEGNGGNLGLGDMSEADGAIPGTSVGSPGHPEGTHIDGHDMDIAYYQVNTPDNTLRSVCNHVEGGQDVYHCTSAPYLLDPWRTALFIGLLHDSDQLRVIGVDGQVGPLIEAATDELCAAGWLSGPPCSSLALAYETENEGLGWYHFHHHHLHVSLLGQSGGFAAGAQSPFGQGPGACLSASCSALPAAEDPRVLLESAPMFAPPDAKSWRPPQR